MINHTPKPWTVVESCVPGAGWDVPELPQGSYRDSRFELEADARLVAAAPALLEVAKTYRDHLVALQTSFASVFGPDGGAPCQKLIGSLESLIARAEGGVS